LKKMTAEVLANAEDERIEETGESA